MAQQNLFPMKMAELGDRFAKLSEKLHCIKFCGCYFCAVVSAYKEMGITLEEINSTLGAPDPDLAIAAKEFKAVASCTSYCFPICLWLKLHRGWEAMHKWMITLLNTFQRPAFQQLIPYAEKFKKLYACCSCMFCPRPDTWAEAMATVLRSEFGLTGGYQAAKY